MEYRDPWPIPPGKEERVLKVLERWVMGEISTGQAERELQVMGVQLPESKDRRV